MTRSRRVHSSTLAQAGFVASAGAVSCSPSARAFSPIRGGSNRLTECEAVDLSAGSFERDLERPVLDPPVLTRQLVKPLLRERAAALLVHVESVIGTGRLPVERDAVRHGRRCWRRPHHEVCVAAVEAERYPPITPAQPACAGPDRPVAGECPVV